MQCPAIQRIVQRRRRARHGHRGGQQFAHLRMQVGATGCIVRLHGGRRRHLAVHALDQPARTAALHRHRLHHRQAEPPLQFGHVDDDAALACGIHHVQRQHHRPAEALDLEHEAQMQAQVGRVGHADDQVRHRLAGKVPGADVAGDLFVGTVRLEAVGAGQIENLQHPARGRREAAFLALHRDAGVVRHLLAAAGELVEQRGLAAVRVPDQGNAQGRSAHAATSLRTLIRAASARRRAKRVKPIWTSNGSPPIGPTATTRTG